MAIFESGDTFSKTSFGMFSSNFGGPDGKPTEFSMVTYQDIDGDSPAGHFTYIFGCLPYPSATVDGRNPVVSFK